MNILSLLLAIPLGVGAVALILATLLLVALAAHRAATWALASASGAVLGDCHEIER